MTRIFFLSLFALVCIHADVHAAKRYWVATAHGKWNATANWSATSGGGGGASVPGASDTAYFNSGGNFNDTFDINVSVKRMEVAGSYTAKIVQGTRTLTIGTGGGVFSGGTYEGGSVSIHVAGALTISGCAFTSTSGLLNCTDNFTLSSGSFTHNSGTFKLSGNSTRSHSGTLTLNVFEVTCTANGTTHTFSSGTFTAKDFKLTGSNQLHLAGNGAIHVTGDIYATNSYIQSSTLPVVTVNGTGPQHFYGHSSFTVNQFPSLVVNTSSDTLHLHDYIVIEGDLTVTSGVLDAGYSKLGLSGSIATITGTFALNMLYFAATDGNGHSYTFSSGTSVTVDSLLYLGYSSGSTGTLRIAGPGVIHATGNIGVTTTTNVAAYAGTPAVISIDGTGSQTLSGNSSAGTGQFPSFTINKSSGTLTLSNTISVAGNWTYTAGTVNAGSSTLCFVGTKTISGSHALNSVTFTTAGSTSTETISSGTTLTVGGTLRIASSSAVVLNTGTIHAKGDVTISNTSISTGGSATIVLNDTNNQTLTGSGTAGQGGLPHVEINKSKGTLTLASVISSRGNWVFTGIGTGSISPGGSIVAFYGAFNLDGQASGSTFCMPFNHVTVNGSTRTLTGNVDCSNFTIASGATCSAGSNKIYVGGDWNSAGTWTYGTSTVVFDGNGYNKIQGATGTITFANVELSRNTVPGTPAKNIRLLNPVLINTSMTLNKGRVYSTATNYLSFADNATCTVTNDDSAYVHGPVRKIGNDVFSFPLGDTTLHDSIAFHPLVISAPVSTGDQFDACYLAVAQTAGSGMVDSLTGLSTSEHWTLNRTAGSSAVTVTVSWNKNSKPSSLSDLRVAAWNSGTSQWADLGQASLALNWPTGTITASATTIFNSNTAVIAPAYTLPKYWGYATLRRKLDGGYYETKNNAIYFRFDDEYNDQNHHLTYSIYNTANTDVAPTLVATSSNAAISSYGDNRFKIDLWTSTSILAAGYYILEVRNEKNEVFYLRFRKS